MDGFDYSEERPSHKVMSFIWNVLTILMLLGVVCVVGYFLLVFTNPDTILNPLRPQPLPPPVTFPPPPSRHAAYCPPPGRPCQPWRRPKPLRRYRPVPSRRC